MDPIKYFANLRPNKTLNHNDSYYEYNDELPLLDALEFWPYQVILIILYSTTAFLSLASNFITIIVLLKGDRISSELWKYLINLSVSDIAMSLLSIPFTYTSFMLNRWIFAPGLCPVVQFTQVCSVFVSVWTLTIIGIDRYNAIVHPLREMSTITEWFQNNKWFLIALLWLVGSCLGSAQLVYSRALPFKYGDEIMFDCREVWDDYYGKVYTIVIFVTTFALPLTILVFVYTTIAYHIWRHVIPGNPDKQRDASCGNRNHKVIKILAMIVVLFAICWLPIHVFSLLVWFYPEISTIETKLEYRTYIWSYFACHFMSMGHSFVNPIVYCFMSENFRSNMCTILNRYLSNLRCRQTDYVFDETESQTQRSQIISLYSLKFKRNRKLDKQLDTKL